MSPTNENAAASASYPLGRNTLASVRLNLQHLLWTTGNPSLLHHSIPLPSEPRTPSEAEPFLIADVGAGTGIWSTSLSLSGTLPSQARIEGFDIDLAQTPPKEWTPANVSWHKLDVLKEPSTVDGSPSLVGRFDVVHVRLLMLIVQNGDPMPLLRRLMALVKPGEPFLFRFCLVCLIVRSHNPTMLLRYTDHLHTTQAAISIGKNMIRSLRNLLSLDNRTLHRKKPHVRVPCSNVCAKPFLSLWMYIVPMRGSRKCMRDSTKLEENWSLMK